jgi:glyoxylase-like metal-dependent hydrolase (beta-lactamase superfamily II)
MKKQILILLFLIITVNLSGQSIKVSDKLTLIQLTDNSYIHTCQNSNGLVYINENDALIVSTPDSELETQNLIDWVVKERMLNIVGYVIDRWHPDAMEGLDIVHQNGIMTYSYELTQQIAKEKGLPIPKKGFNPKTVIEVGSEKVICHFLGEAHTKDGIVVWIPSEQILFGGNEIRNYNGWVGNIADANLDCWSETVARVQKEYGSAKIVIPGHGKHGGAELIDYTIGLYKVDNKSRIWNNQELSTRQIMDNNEDFHVTAESDSIQNGERILKNAILFAQDFTKYAKVESPLIIYQPDKKRIDSDYGRLRIYDKISNGEKLRTDVFYKKLIIFKEIDSVGLRIILKEMEK